MSNGTGFFLSLGTNYTPRFEMADFLVLLLVFEVAEHFELLNEILEDNDDIATFSPVSCFMRRDLNTGGPNIRYEEYVIYMFKCIG